MSDISSTHEPDTLINSKITTSVGKIPTCSATLNFPDGNVHTIQYTDNNCDNLVNYIQEVYKLGYKNGQKKGYDNGRAFGYYEATNVDTYY